MSPPATIRILGIDPGSRVTGFGMIDYSRSGLRHVDSGCIRVSGDALAQRLTHIFDAVSDLVTALEPQQLAIEQVFMHRNAGSALKLGQARGAALVACATRGIDVYEYAPNQIKQSVTGQGHAAKTQVQHMIKVLLGLEHPPADDQADALAVAICHGHVQETARRIERNAAGGIR